MLHPRKLSVIPPQVYFCQCIVTVQFLSTGLLSHTFPKIPFEQLQCIDENGLADELRITS